MANFGTSSIGDTPPVVKNLLYINILLFVITFVCFNNLSIDLTNILGLHYYKSEYFHWWQFVTHMFMHAIFLQGGGAHIFFNMFALWMFGRVLENVWGSKRFLIYYMVTGIGAALFDIFVNYLSYSSLEAAITAFANTPSPEAFSGILHKHFEAIYDANQPFINSWGNNLSDPEYAKQAVASLQHMYTSMINIPTVGA